MKRCLKAFSTILVLVLMLFVFACDKPTPTPEPIKSSGEQINSDGNKPVKSEGTLTPEPITDPVDYASEVKFSEASGTKWAKVTVKTYVDGDTTHFYIDDPNMNGGVIKARYLGINTPESTGKIEEYGKAASTFTKTKLMEATSIIVESDDGIWNADSTGGRYLVWVWYRTNESEEYRNLNIEILQEGLAIASSSANNRYGETCVKAINQAKALKLKVYSGEKDPDFYYGEAQEITLNELRTNIEEYVNTYVAFEAVVVRENSETVYVEEFDPETNMYNGIAVYYGFSASGDVLKILEVGNRVRIVGSVQYYEAGGTYQISGLKYRAMKPKDPSNVQKIGEGYSASYTLTDADTFVNGKVEVETDEELKEFSYANLAMNSTISMENLQVKSVYTTNNEDSSSKGAMTLTCEVDGITVKVRTVVMYDDNKQLITEDAFLNKNINVKGLVDYFNGEYQIKIFTMNDVTFNG